MVQLKILWLSLQCLLGPLPGPWAQCSSSLRMYRPEQQGFKEVSNTKANIYYTAADQFLLWWLHLFYFFSLSFNFHLVIQPVTLFFKSASGFANVAASELILYSNKRVATQIFHPVLFYFLSDLFSPFNFFPNVLFAIVVHYIYLYQSLQ